MAKLGMWAILINGAVLLKISIRRYGGGSNFRKEEIEMVIANLKRGRLLGLVKFTMKHSYGIENG